jgi:hypothetical protein
VILSVPFWWDAECGGPMQLRLNDPSYTDRLANFLRSLGQTALVAGPGQLEVDLPHAEDSRFELEIYLRVWRVLYPDADVQLENDGDEAPAA